MFIKALTTKTCVKCKSIIPKVSALCEEKGVSFEVLDISESKENLALARKYNVFAVPAFIINSGDSEECLHGEDAYYDIKSMLI